MIKRVRLTVKPKRRIRLTPDPTLNCDGEEPALDLIARRVVMASMIYYGLGESIVDDSTFDGWCRKLALRWYRLDRVRQWQLGSPEAIRTTGYHVKVTMAAASGAVAWAAEQGLGIKGMQATKPWRRSKKYGRYLTPEDFRQV